MLYEWSKLYVEQIISQVTCEERVFGSNLNLIRLELNHQLSRREEKSSSKYYGISIH